ncbi:MAG TPA: alpha/beta hydrolase [Cyclobacteriaceae bacterium]|nr:alpha/beta hydrolase [Cyclobacteriaceae bacterium]
MQKLIIFFTLCLISLVSFSQSNPLVVPLWQNGAPGFENRRNEPEQAKDWWVKNIHNPSITIFLPPKEKATGAAVVVCPGGGHRELVFNAEGVEAAEFLNSIGVAVFVLKYRLAREENSPYKFDNVKQDAYRAMRLVRSRAAEWGVDVNRLGMLGFSAGGEVVAMVAYGDGQGDKNAKDPIDRENGKPDFQMLVYPGPSFIPETIDSTAPPAFLVVANDDPCCSGSVVEILNKYRKTTVPIEVHIYAQGKHAFNMGNRSQLVTLKTWPQRMADWLGDNGYLKK